MALSSRIEQSPTEPADDRLHGARLADAVDWMIRSDGRSPGADVAACLSLEGRALHAVLGDVPARDGAAPLDEGGPLCHLSRHEDGRISLSLVRPVQPERPDLHPRAWVPVSAEQLEAIAGARASLAEMARAADAELDALLGALSPEALAQVIHDATDSVDHTDPVLLHVDDASFTNVDRFNNLLARPGSAPDDRFLLDRLSRLPTPELSLPERRFLGVMHLLRQANLRAEELNGRQFTPWALSAFFDLKYQQYARVLESAGPDAALEPWPGGLAARAACLGRLKQQLQETHVVYRWIDGLTLRKEERWRARDLKKPARSLPAAVAGHCLERFGVSAHDTEHHDAFFLEVVRRIALLDGEEARTAAFEALLEVMVRATMEEVPSVIGMTRGTRDLRHLQDALEEGRYADVCATPIEDGFCAVFAREDARVYERPPLPRILTAIARRMEFNHRHYLPGHFTAADVPVRPHFYYPPAMADLTENAEDRHTGHTVAKVRYSIRSPAPLRIAGRSWTGLVDLRLMRAVGHPYTEADLVIVARHTDYIRSIAQAVLALKAAGLRAPVVTGFHRDDYDRRYPQPTSPQVAPAAAPTGPAIGPMLHEAMGRHGEAGAIVCSASGRTFTLTEIQAVAGRLAAIPGVGPGQRVGVVCGERAHQALLITAGLAAGLVVCPLDHAMPPRALEALLRHAAPELVLTDAAAQVRPESLPGTVLQAEALLSSAAGPSPLPDSGAGGLLIYTSGVTGLPKGVLLDERRLGANVAFARDHFGYDAAPPWTSGCLLPLHHTFAIVSDLLPVLCAGGRVVVVPGFDAGDAGAVANAFGRHQVRSFSAVPIILEALLALSVPLPPSLSFAISGAAPLLERSRLRYLERHGHPIVPCYGLTESVCFATAAPLTAGGACAPGSVGRAAGIAIKIVGEDLLPLRTGEQGEIALRGASVVTAYHGQRPEISDPSFEDGWLLTGDVGRLDEEGNLYITGRRKDMLIRGGEKLYLEDLDRCLQEHPALADACSVQIPGLFGFERAVSFLVASGAGGASAQEESLRAHVRERLGPLGVPDELCWIDRIPRSATGKPLRAALRSRWAGAV